MRLVGLPRMPIYEYVCMSCESHFEELVGLNAPDPAVRSYRALWVALKP